MKGKTNEDTLKALTNNLYKSLDEKQHTASAFIDFSKAFHTVDHDIVIFKLEFSGINACPLEDLRVILRIGNIELKLEAVFQTCFL